MLHSHETQQVPWGSAYRKSRPQAPLTLYRIEGEPPTPYHGSLPEFSQPQQTRCFSLSSQIPYCPHGCGALHPGQAEGMQQGERGRHKQEQKQLRFSGGGMKQRASWDHYLTTTVTLQKDKDEVRTGVKPQAYAEGENPC